MPHPNLVQFNQFSISSPDVSMTANQNRPSSEPPASSLSPPLNTKRGNETGVLKGQRVDRERRERHLHERPLTE